MVSNPHNNPQLCNRKKFNGVGGHLFAIAIKESLNAGYEGFVFGNAANKQILKHYCDNFNAIVLDKSTYLFIINDKEASRILKGYKINV